MTDKEWEEKLIELEFGLLDEAEADRVRAELAKNPKWTAKHDQVKAQRATLRQAARWPGPPTSLSLPSLARSPAAEPSTPLPWFLSPWALAASLLLALGLGEEGWYRVRQAQAHREQARLTLASPATFSAAEELPLAVVVEPERTDQAIPRELLIASAEKNESPSRERFSVDALGNLSLIAHRPDNIAVETRRQTVRVQPSARAESPRYLSYLGTDRGWYRPGEALLLRGVTLERASLSAARPAGETLFNVQDSTGQRVWSAPGELWKGTAQQQWKIPDELPAGKYIVSLESSLDSASRDQKEIFIEQTRAPRLQMKLNLPHQSWRLGQSVEAELTIRKGDGQSVPEQEVFVRLTQRELVLDEARITTSTDGSAPIALKLPWSLAPGGVELSAETSWEGLSESVQREIPILSSEVDLSFFPEGGPLVAGIEQRIFFQARDVHDRPVAVTGRVLDERGASIADFAGNAAGRGSFRLRVKPDQRFSIELREPAGLLPLRTIPSVSQEKTSIRPTRTVFGPQDPLEFELPSAEPGARQLVVASCRGAIVGMAPAIAGAPVRCPLTSSASGVIRVTLFDRVTQGRRPLAERLVYRHPLHRAQIQASLATEEKRSKWTIRVEDENQRPLRDAIVGVSLVDRRWLDRDARPMPSPEEHFLIRSSIRSPQDFESSTISIAPSPGAEQELDLVLATHGWRTFAEVVDRSPTNDDEIAVVQSVPTPAGSRDWEQQHAMHQQLLVATGLVSVVSLLLRWLLTRLGLGLPARLGVIALVIALGGWSIARWMASGHVESAAPTAEVPSPPTAPSEPTPTGPPLPADPPSPASTELADTFREEPAVSKVAAPSARRMMAGSAAATKEIRGADLSQAEETSPLANRAAEAAPAIPPASAPVVAPAAKRSPRVKTYVRLRSGLAWNAPEDSPAPSATLLWEPQGVTDAQGLLVLESPAPPAGNYLLSVDVHTEEGRLGSIRQEVSIPAP